MLSILTSGCGGTSLDFRDPPEAGQTLDDVSSAPESNGDEPASDSGAGIDSRATVDSAASDGAAGDVVAPKPDASPIDEGLPPKCKIDSECPTGLCNWKTSLCISELPLASPCLRDAECESSLCNWKTDRCSVPAPLGAACKRDVECEGDLCNWSTDRCAVKAAKGDACSRDTECSGGKCWSSHCL